MPAPKQEPAWVQPFLTELARTGNVTASAEVAGVDRTNAQARRKRVAGFAAAWDVALAEYRAGRSFQRGLSAASDEARPHSGGPKMMRVEALLVAWSERSFDPDAVPMPADGAMPKVTVSEAIKIVQSKRPSARAASGAGKKHADPFFDGWEEDAAEHEAAVERLVGKLERLGAREDARKAEAGWVRCEVHDTWVPPGWVYRPEVVLPAGGEEEEGRCEPL